jgi:hypothetical protein
LKKILGIAVLIGCGCTQTSPPAELPKAWTPNLEQLVPADVDLVIRLDAKRARQQGSLELWTQVLKDMGLSLDLLQAVEQCAPRSLLFAFRLGEKGLDGDVIGVWTGVSAVEPVPCGIKGWKRTGNQRDFDVFEPIETSTKRSSLALMLRSREGELMLVSLGQVDALLRLLKDGPDANRMTASGQGELVFEVRWHDELVPTSWEGKAPGLLRVTEGLSHGKISMQLVENIEISASLFYSDEQAASTAGERLREVKRALEQAGKKNLQSIGESAHASLRGVELRVELQVPLAP